MIRYPELAEVVALNLHYGGPDAGVRGVDGLKGIEAALDRPTAGFGDYEHYATLWEKAGVLLHGLASTQYFVDGNKRTAWLATKSFLSSNGADIGDVPQVHALAMTVALSKNLIEVEEAAEWFELQHGLRRRGPAKSPLLEYFFLAGQSVLHDGVFDVQGGALIAFRAAQLPGKTELVAMGRFHPDSSHTGKRRVLEIQVHNADRTAVLTKNRLPMPEPDRSTYWHHQESDGFMPVVFRISFALKYETAGAYEVELLLDGEVLAVAPLRVEARGASFFQLFE